LPKKPAVLLLRLAESLRLSPIYRWIYATASQESFVSISKIEGRLGFHPRYSNREALIRNYDWYVAHRLELGTLTGITHRVPWKKGVLGLVEYFF